VILEIGLTDEHSHLIRLSRFKRYLKHLIITDWLNKYRAVNHISSPLAVELIVGPQNNQDERVLVKPISRMTVVMLQKFRLLFDQIGAIEPAKLKYSKKRISADKGLDVAS
jgi:hypothetical protein